MCSLPYQRIVDNMRYENAGESGELGLGIVLHERWNLDCCLTGGK